MIGAFRHRLVIEVPVETQDEGGGSSVTWQSAGTSPVVWGRIVPVAAERNQNRLRDGHRITHRIILRYRDDVLPAWRLRKDGRFFYIRSLLPPDESKRFLEIMAEEINP